jgi:hypothetical protein
MNLHNRFTLEAGQLMPDGTVFVGVCTPKDRDGKSLGKTLNLFAMPYDLGLDEKGQGSKLVIKFMDTVKAVAKIKNFLGSDGFNHDVKNKTPDQALYDGLMDGTALKKWFIPTWEMIAGRDSGGEQVQTDTLFAHKDEGAFKDTFTLASGSASADWYWSCSEPHKVPSHVYGVRLSDGSVGWGLKDNASLSCRPLRAELKVGPERVAP